MNCVAGVSSSRFDAISTKLKLGESQASSYALACAAEKEAEEPESFTEFFLDTANNTACFLSVQFADMVVSWRLISQKTLYQLPIYPRVIFI